MSFSAKVKEELERHIGTARHCQLAELAPVFALCGHAGQGDDGFFMEFSSENQLVVRKCFTLLEKTFNINACSRNDMESSLRKNGSYTIRIDEDAQVRRVLAALKLLDGDRLVAPEGLVDPLLVQSGCCRRAFVRGAFLASGSISDPNKFYHFEIVCDTPAQAEQVREVLNSFIQDAKVVQRKKYYVVYVKEGTQIADLLNVMEASVGLMDFENVRIIKEMRNSINRQVNCEIANQGKTVDAAMRQIADIQYIRDTIGLSSLKPALQEMASARLENPDMKLQDLGMLMSPPVGKSGVNHRLRKLSEIADDLRKGV
jgi:hypothetical protein